MDVIRFIEKIRHSHSSMVNVSTKGSCLNFFYILKEVWPEAECWYNSDHVITKIGDYWFDINGSVSPKGYQKIENTHSGETLRKIKFQMLKEEYNED